MVCLRDLCDRSWSWMEPSKAVSTRSTIVIAEEEQLPSRRPEGNTPAGPYEPEHPFCPGCDFPNAPPKRRSGKCSQANRELSTSESAAHPRAGGAFLSLACRTCEDYGRGRRDRQASLRSPSPRRSFLECQFPMYRIAVTPTVLPSTAHLSEI
jgi:hypothetical protein